MGMPEGLKVIDGQAVEHPPKVNPTPHSIHEGEIEYLFPGVVDRGSTIDEMIRLMDQFGIEKRVFEVAVTHSEDYNLDSGIKAVRKYPDRLVPYCSDYTVSPRDGMAGVRRLEELVKEFGIKLLHIAPYRVGYPPNDKSYYPLYAKCVELDIPVTINVGIPLPRQAGGVQDPIYLDEVCYFFPELTVVATHGGVPWQALCVKLLLKWPNLYYMDVLTAPKYYPPEIIYYMNTRGAGKVLFCTGHPVIPFDRAMSEVKELPLRDHVWAKFLRENAIKVFKL